MSNSHDDVDKLEHAKTLDVIARFCRAAFALIDAKRMPSVNTAMLALLAEIDDELEKIEPPLH